MREKKEKKKVREKYRPRAAPLVRARALSFLSVSLSANSMLLRGFLSLFLYFVILLHPAGLANFNRGGRREVFVL